MGLCGCDIVRLCECDIVRLCECVHDVCRMGGHCNINVQCDCDLLAY